jgi:hypothetical protein
MLAYCECVALARDVGWDPEKWESLRIPEITRIRIAIELQKVPSRL